MLTMHRISAVSDTFTFGQMASLTDGEIGLLLDYYIKGTVPTIQELQGSRE